MRITSMITSTLTSTNQMQEPTNDFKTFQITFTKQLSIKQEDRTHHYHRKKNMRKKQKHEKTQKKLKKKKIR